jgi:hypothetical protein
VKSPLRELTVGPASDDALSRNMSDGGRKGETHGRLPDLLDRFADQIRARYPQIP